jgi:hypothetical protein
LLNEMQNGPAFARKAAVHAERADCEREWSAPGRDRTARLSGKVTSFDSDARLTKMNGTARSISLVANHTCKS